ncbi:hypothetical protein M3J07_004126 [Ascochyta lentis]
MSRVHRSVRPLPRAQQVVDVGQVARRLSHTADSTAQVLYTIVNMQTPLPETQAMRQLVQKMYALAAALSSLGKELIESGEQDVWTEEHNESLLHSMNKCDDIFRGIIRAVRETDETSNVLPRSTAGDYKRAFLCDDGKKARDALDKCFELVNQTSLAVRHETLARKEYLDEDEMPEALRLIWAFEQPVLGDIQAYKDGLRASEQLQRYLTPSPTPAFSANQTKDQPELDSLTAPSTKSKDSMPKEPIAVSAYNQWPPFGNPQHPAYIAPVAEQPKENSKMTVNELSRVLAPNSNTFPQTGPNTRRPSTPELTPQTEPGTTSSGQPNITKPTPNGSKLFKEIPFVSYAKHDRSNVNLFAPALRLEACILRPTVQSTDTGSTLSYETELLQLDEETMQAQIRQLGPHYSVMDSLLDLRPQQLHLVQSHAIQRSGVIVFAQHGKPVELPTLMGTLQASPVVLMLEAASVFAQDQFRALEPTPLVPGTTPTLRSDYLGDTTLVTGFNMPNTGSVFSSRHYLSSPEAFSEHLREQGEPCTYVEGTERKGAFQCYQTITLNPEWHKNDRSLEEIRLADYDAGRKGPMTTNKISYPWDERGSLFEGLGQVRKVELTPSTEVDVSRTK